MQFYSTNNKKIRVSLQDAVMQGLAPDGGLYMPLSFNQFPESFIRRLPELSLRDIAWAVAVQLIGDDVPKDELEKIINHTISFDAPLVKVAENTFSLELFHGPTLAFKDFGARFLSGLLGYFARIRQQEIVILVATSGDTGSAVANGFLNVEGTRVVVLYPSGKVSDLQEKQFTTLGGNITALEIDGTFDDCQRIVKAAFLDKDLQQQHALASANSINIARLIPQSFYYFHAYAQLAKVNSDIVFAVPSGNFGNLTAGLIAKKLGLPVKHFIAATNINDIVPAYLKSGSFSPRPSIETISNAMDVGSPSNFARMEDMYANSAEALGADISGYAFTDKQTATAMQTLFSEGYLADPHGAVAWLGLQQYKKDNPGNYAGVFFETAHPGKFREVVEKTIGHKIELPEKLLKFESLQKHSIHMPDNFEAVKAFLMNM